LMNAAVRCGTGRSGISLAALDVRISRSRWDEGIVA
jgi:hypothetical protein